MTNTLIKTSIEAISREEEFGHEINIDVQSYTRRQNSTVDYQKLLKQSSRAARGLFSVFSNMNWDV